MFQYLFSVFCSSSTHVFQVFFVEKSLINIPRKDIVDIILHTNIINFFLFLILFNIQKARGKINFKLSNIIIGRSNFVQFILFFFPVVASVYKSFLLGYVQPSTLVIASILIPFGVWILAIFLLKERFKPIYLPLAFLGLLGFVIVNYNKFGTVTSLGFSQTALLAFYIFLASIGDITRRYYCRKRADGMEAVFAEIFLYFIYGTVFLLIRGHFSLELLFNKYVWIIALMAFSHHVFIIFGVRKATSVASLEFINFAKIIFVMGWSYVLLSEIPTTQKIIGAIIIGVSVGLFDANERITKRKLKAKGQNLFDKKTIEAVQESNNNNK